MPEYRLAPVQYNIRCKFNKTLVHFTPSIMVSRGTHYLQQRTQRHTTHLNCKSKVCVLLFQLRYPKPSTVCQDAWLNKFLSRKERRGKTCTVHSAATPNTNYRNKIDNTIHIWYLINRPTFQHEIQLVATALHQHRAHQMGCISLLSTYSESRLSQLHTFQSPESYKCYNCITNSRVSYLLINSPDWHRQKLTHTLAQNGIVSADLGKFECDKHVVRQASIFPLPFQSIELEIHGYGV